MKEWVIVACRAEAKIFERDTSTKKLHWLKTLKNKKGRRRERDFDTDRPGMSFAKGWGSSPHGLVARHLHAENIARKFAHKLCEVIKAGHDEGSYKKAHVFASPKFLGKLKQELGRQMNTDGLSFVAKNLEYADDIEILSRL